MGFYFVKILESFFVFVGRVSIDLLKFINSLLYKFGHFILFHLGLWKDYFRLRRVETIEQIETIGNQSFWVIALTAVFTGMVLAIQFYNGFSRFGAEGLMGYPIFIAITRELGPVFAALMLTSRAISAMAAELSSMRVGEQIDAIEVMGVSSKVYLIVPRVVASVVSLPLLVILFDLIGNVSAWFISVYVLGVNAEVYQSGVVQYLQVSDIGTSIIKGVVFGYLIGIIGVYMGYFAKGGARGVGIATTKAVVFSAVSIFGANYLLSALFLMIGW